jgi:hypothetical protein
MVSKSSQSVIIVRATISAQKASEMMKIYLGENPDSSEAIEFLCLAEGGEVTHYEVLSAMAGKLISSAFMYIH